MYCQFCHHDQTRVLNSRLISNGMGICRQRECLDCGKCFSTVERSQLMVVKRDGIPEELNREKVIQGVRRTCQGRGISESQLEKLAQKMEESLREKGTPRMDSNDIGLAILEPLKELDEVGYLRPASVYESFSSTGDFAQEIASMRKGRGPQVNGNEVKKD